NADPTKNGASEGIRTLEDVERPKRSSRGTGQALARLATFHVVMLFQKSPPSTRLQKLFVRTSRFITIEGTLVNLAEASFKTLNRRTLPTFVFLEPALWRFRNSHVNFESARAPAR